MGINIGHSPVIRFFGSKCAWSLPKCLSSQLVLRRLIVKWPTCSMCSECVKWLLCAKNIYSMASEKTLLHVNAFILCCSLPYVLVKKCAFFVLDLIEFHSLFISIHFQNNFITQLPQLVFSEAFLPLSSSVKVALLQAGPSSPDSTVYFYNSLDKKTRSNKQ